MLMPPLRGNGAYPPADDGCVPPLIMLKVIGRVAMYGTQKFKSHDRKPPTNSGTTGVYIAIFKLWCEHPKDLSRAARDIWNVASVALQPGKQARRVPVNPIGATVTFACISIGATVAAAYTGSAMQNFYLYYALALFSFLISAAMSMAIDVPVDSRRVKKALIIVLCVAAALRLATQFGALHLTVDLSWYGDYLRFASEGLQPYRDFYFPYPQGFAVLIEAFGRAHLPSIILHFLFISVDVGAVYAIYILSRSIMNECAALCGASMYAFLPMAVLESGSSGHFDSLAGLAALIVLIFVIRRRPALAATFLAVGGSIKVFPLALAPALVYAMRRRSDILKSTAAFFAVTLLTLAALGSSGVAALNFYANAGYASNSARAYIESFLSNSLPQLAHDLPALGAIVPIAEAFALVCVFVTVLLGIRPAVDKPRDRFERTLKRLCTPNYSGIASVAFSLILLVYGAYVALSPTGDLYMAYTWWTPMSVTILRGLAMAGFAAVALYEALRWSFRAEAPAAQIVTLMGIVLGILILSRPDVNTWYVVPVAAIICASRSKAVAIALVAALSMYWAAWPSSSFASSDFFSPVIQAGPNAVVVTLEGAPSIERSIALPVQQLSPNNAVAFSVASDYDPTLGNQPVSLSVAAQGLDKRGRAVVVPILVHYASATRDFTIAQRYVQWRFFPQLRTLQGLKFKVHAERHFSGSHSFRITETRIVDERYADMNTFAVIGAGGVAVFVFLIAFSGMLANGRRREESHLLHAAD